MHLTLRTRLRVAAVAALVSAAACACSADQVAPVAPQLAKGGPRGGAPTD